MDNSDISILIIDDQQAVIRSLSLMLRTKRFDNVHSIDCPLHMDAAIEKYDPQVILLDLNMPELSGQTVLKKLNIQYPDIYTIIISANDELDTRMECQQLGAFNFFNKPIDFKSLINDLIKIQSLNVNHH